MAHSFDELSISPGFFLSCSVSYFNARSLCSFVASLKRLFVLNCMKVQCLHSFLWASRDHPVFLVLWFARIGRALVCQGGKKNCFLSYLSTVSVWCRLILRNLTLGGKIPRLHGAGDPFICSVEAFSAEV